MLQTRQMKGFRGACCSRLKNGQLQVKVINLLNL